MNPMGMPQGGGGGYQASGPGYQVMTVDASCCSPTIPAQRIADAANQMAASGYKLLQAYIDIRNTCGPFCPTKCVVLIFRRNDIV